MMRLGAVVLLLALAAGPALVVGADYPSIAAALKANNMKLFMEAADRTGFTSQLQSPGFIGTIFAPTDDAFQTALDVANVTKKQLFNNNTLLVDVIMYHVVPGDAISSERLRDEGQYTSMRGKALTITKSLGGDVAVNSGSTATLVERDLKAGAAMFNVVDNLLLPPDELAALNLKQAQTVKFLTTLDEAAGYDDSLTTLYGLIQSSGLANFMADKKTVATLFAPVDDAWYTIDQMSMYYTGNTSAVTSNKKALSNLLKYHIVEGRAIRASQLKDKMKLKMMNGESVTIHVTDKKAKKNVEDIARDQVVAARISGVPPSMHIILAPNTDGDEATITTADIIAGRSYVHKVDAVLVPQSMLTYLEDFTAKKTGNKTKKGNATVAEALTGGNSTVNGTSAKNASALAKTNATKTANKSMIANTTSNSTSNTTRSKPAAKATSGAADMAVTALIGLPSLMMAAFMVLV